MDIKRGRAHLKDGKYVVWVSMEIDADRPVGLQIMEFEKATDYAVMRDDVYMNHDEDEFVIECQVPATPKEIEDKLKADEEAAERLVKRPNKEKINWENIFIDDFQWA